MAWAQQEGLGSYTYEELTRHDKVRATLQGYVDELNAGLAPHEQLKRFSILPRDLSVDAGDLTPSLKVKRKSVETKYKEVLDSMYEGTLDSL
jgi:long-chain acyl-CoA synthetase